MAARLHPRHSDQVRQKIQASVIIDRLQKHFLGQLEMTREQLKSAEILLDRSVPKISQIQGAADDGAHVFRIEAPWVQKAAAKRGWV